jgi:hypothetical protein
MGPPAAFLAKLAPGVEVAAGKVRGLGAAAPALIEAGWLASRREGRLVLVSLTPTGEAERTRILSEPPAAKPPRARAAARPAAARAPKATAAARLAALEDIVAALTARVAALEGTGAEAAPTAANHRAVAGDPSTAAGDPDPATAAAATDDPAGLRATIIAIVGDLDAGHRLGGLVPIPDVRAELRRRGVTAADADVTAALEALERSWVFDLSIAQAPNAVRDRAAGIERAGRGLLYYVARR